MLLMMRLFVSLILVADASFCTHSSGGGRRGLKRVAPRAESCNLSTDSCNFPSEITGAQTFSFAAKFPQNSGFPAPILYIWKKISDRLKFHSVATLGQLFTHIASSSFSAPRNLGTKGSFRRLSGYDD